MPAPNYSIFTGRMLFLTSNQQCQRTEGKYTVIHKKTWQYISDHNSGKSWWILIIFTHLETMPSQSASKLFTYLFFMWRKYDVSVKFMTLTSCNSVLCTCGEAWSSCWLMTQLTNGQCTCMLVFMPMVDILNIPCDCQFVFFFCTQWTLCFTPRLMQWVIF